MILVCILLSYAEKIKTILSSKLTIEYYLNYLIIKDLLDGYKLIDVVLSEPNDLQGLIVISYKIKQIESTIKSSETKKNLFPKFQTTLYYEWMKLNEVVISFKDKLPPTGELI